MKRIIFTLMVVLMTALTFTSCTEEEVSPTASDNGGGKDIIIVKQ